jgi:ABC-type Fe3+-siderophore transport system permease subunit
MTDKHSALLRRNEANRLERWLPTLAIVIMGLSIVFAGIMFTSVIADPALGLRAFGVSAAVLGAAGAGVRLYAHNGSKALDAFGKMLGFSAALLAMYATLILFLFDAIVPKSS